MPGKANVSRAANSGILGSLGKGGKPSRKPCYGRPANSGILSSKKTPQKSTGSW